MQSDEVASGSCRLKTNVAVTQTTQKETNSSANRSQLLKSVTDGKRNTVHAEHCHWCRKCRSDKFTLWVHFVLSIGKTDCQSRVACGEPQKQTTLTSKYTHNHRRTCLRIYRMRQKQKKKEATNKSKFFAEDIKNGKQREQRTD